MMTRAEMRQAAWVLHTMATGAKTQDEDELARKAGIPPGEINCSSPRARWMCTFDALNCWEAQGEVGCRLEASLLLSEAVAPAFDEAPNGEIRNNGIKWAYNLDSGKGVWQIAQRWNIVYPASEAHRS